jgi:site-specific DNA recombinase
MLTDTTLKSAVAYCRVSSAVQEERQTIQNQIEFAEKFCDLQGIKLCHIYKDDGVTGTLPLNERPAGNELLHDAKDGKFDLVLLFKLDRLGRSTRVILNAVHDLDKYGVKVRSMTEPFDTSDASGRFLLTILAGVADLERSNILQRMSIGTTRAAQDGKWLGGIVPYGYKVVDGYLEPNTDIIPNTNMSEVDVVRFIFERVAEGISTVKVADMVNALGIPPAYVAHGIGGKRRKRVNHEWLQGRIYNMVISTTYKGVHRYGKRSAKNREVVERKVPPIVSEELWVKVQAQLKQNRIVVNGKKNNWLLRGLIYCEHCGKRYYGFHTKGYYLYRDGGRSAWKRQRMDKPCFGISVNMKWLDDIVWEDCLSFIRNPQLVVSSVKHQEKQNQDTKRGIALIRSKIVSKQSERDKAVSLCIKGIISEETLSAQLQGIENDVRMLQHELGRLEEVAARKNSVMKSQETAVTALELLKERLDNTEVSQEIKESVIRAMVEKITVRTLDDRAVVTVHFQFGDTPTHDYDKKLLQLSARASVRINVAKTHEYLPPPHSIHRKPI